jgi:PilZ domain
VTIELQAGKDQAPVLGNLTDMSLGGCFVETSALMTPGTAVKLVFSIDDGKMPAEGIVVRMDPGTGVAVQFNDMNRVGREGLHRILEFVQRSSAHYDNHYFKNLLNR